MMTQAGTYEIRPVWPDPQCNGDGSHVQSYPLSHMLYEPCPPECFGLYRRDSHGFLMWLSDHDSEVSARGAMGLRRGTA